MSDIQNAFRLIGSLDLTSLSHDDTEEKIAALCAKAVTALRNDGRRLRLSGMGAAGPQTAEENAGQSCHRGQFSRRRQRFQADERRNQKSRAAVPTKFDAVFPYRDFLAGNTDSCRRFLDIIQRECGKHTSKIILETGELNHVSTIAAAVKLCLEYDIDFIKTSTGKTPVSATVGAANIILETIRDSGRDVGFKASGGIREFEEARKYLILSEVILGADWPDPAHFRIAPVRFWTI